ncbi:MAG: polysaccharide biosynthesis tyrosine autokinase, partial [Acidobacteriota bacterium]
GLISGLVLGVSTAFLIEYLDDTAKSSEDVSQILGLNTLGTVVRFPKVRKLRDGLVTIEKARSPYAEAYRSLRTNLQFSSLANPAAALVVTSAGPREGKSTTLANIGVAIAQSGKRVILADTDLRHPSLHKFFGLPEEPGITNVLLGEIHNLDSVLRETEVPGLHVLVSGTHPPNPAELLASRLMGGLVEALKQRADIVLLDSPPILPVTDATLLAAKAGSVLWVIDAGTTRTDVLRKAKEALAQVDAKILGVVLNRASEASAYGYYYWFFAVSSG